PHAMHGLILNRAMDTVVTQADTGDANVSATLDAENFGGHWPSKTQLTISATLTPRTLVLQVIAKNIGTEDLPMGIGWHPYFVIPSGERAQARLRIPATQRVVVNNYDDVFPTGKLVPVAGSPYDFTAANGAPLGKMYLDDCFVLLQRDSSGATTAELIDPASHYGLRVEALSNDITAFQAYAPLDKSYVALEPQFNWGDPFNNVWQGAGTGMSILRPGQSVTYRVQLELFVP
ncbi:MAG: aldose 1-epimerase, partial [Bryobacteraceae bacterium]